MRTIATIFKTPRRPKRSDNALFYDVAEYAERKSTHLYLGPPLRKPDASGSWVHVAYSHNWSTSGEIVIEHSHQAGFFWRKGKMGASIHTGWREFSGVFMKIIARRAKA